VGTFVVKLIQKKISGRRKNNQPALDRNASRQLSDLQLLKNVFFKPGIDENNVMQIAAEIYMHRKKISLSIDDNVDILIAAWCITADATLVTSNIKHFTGIDGLMIENWCE